MCFQYYSDNLKETDIKQTIDNAKIAIAELQLILAEINKGEGTIGKLVKDKKMYENLEAATSNLDKLLVDVKANPYRYVNVSIFGGQKRNHIIGGLSILIHVLLLFKVGEFNYILYSLTYLVSLLLGHIGLSIPNPFEQDYHLSMLATSRL